MFRSFTKWIAVAGCAVLLGACGSPDVAEPYPPIVSRAAILGEWTLRTVNGQQMPYTLSSTATTSSVLMDEDWDMSDAYAAHGASSNDYTGTAVTAIHIQARTAVTYAFDGTTVTLLVGSHAGAHLKWAGDSLTWMDAGLLKVFRRK